MMNEKLTFEEIFKYPGIYKSDSFAEGAAFLVEKNELKIIVYSNKDDILPTKQNAVVYAGLFDKEYTKIFTIKSLFE